MSHTRAIWDDGREPGRAVVALGVAVALSAIVINIAMVGRVSMFFDLWFVLLSLGLAVLVRPGDFFTVGVLPPLIMVGAFTVLAVDRPGAIATAQDGVVQAVVSGLAHHSVALVCGYALCLATLMARQRAAR
ncbi:hypothetical protein ISU10_17845 [Nocardioides agariphilus]|uniref:DUF6542 domain-containing protein n=1 Tax=Nocardioides agariphilus TaxID=433664 RepID=A0A930YNX5_9ACTN|nr:hypothetical protein [Nocardioides agariphilus]